MTGFVVLRALSDLDMIANTVSPSNPPEMALALACRAHYPAMRDVHEIDGKVLRELGHVVLAAGDALDRIRTLVASRRAATERRVRSQPFRDRARRTR